MSSSSFCDQLSNLMIIVCYPLRKNVHTPSDDGQDEEAVLCDKGDFSEMEKASTPQLKIQLDPGDIIVEDEVSKSKGLTSGFSLRNLI